VVARGDAVTALAGFERFESRDFDVGDGVRIHARVGGDAAHPPVLLLHGYPQTHVIWHKVASRLAQRHHVVCADLRGYGDSSKPAGAADHANYSKRAMAADMATVMRALGHEHFALVGHDRGGRVAHRLAVDHPGAVARLCVIDISPTLTMYDRTDFAFAQAYWHWFFLTQPSPLPEAMLAADPKRFLRGFLAGLGNDASTFAPAAVAAYERCWATPEGLHASCEDYRASAGIDLVHDRASDAAGNRVRCPMLVLWGDRGVVGRLFDPLADWRAKCDADVRGAALAAGHFIPEEVPDALLAALLPFLDA
jgi:haloacetate dehalogenase